MFSFYPFFKSRILVTNCAFFFIVGVFFDNLGNYTLAFLLAGIPPIVGAALMFSIYCVRGTREGEGRKEEKEEEEERQSLSSSATETTIEINYEEG